MIQQRFFAGAGLLATLLGSTSAFTTPSIGRSASSLFATSQPDVVVISPPGGIGEIASIEAARLGGSVKWFVISAPSSTSSPIALTAETLAAIEKAGGSMELAGATADSLLPTPDSKDDSSSTSSNDSALSAMAAWCANSKSLICTYDGALEEKKRVDRNKSPEQIENSVGINEEELIRSGIRVAMREAVRGGSAGSNTRKIAVLAAGEEVGDDESKKGDGGLFAGLFGGKEEQIPESMAEAMEGAMSVIRHGELFGAPESSPESSPFMAGPRRDPIVREMYTMRSVRIDPTVSVSGNILSGGEGSKSNRLAVGEAASRLALSKVAAANNMKAMDVSLTSFAATESPTDEEWNAEFTRVAEMLASPTGGARLFSAEFSSVPSTKRLAEWIAQKWAPAILRSYDIAGTRVGSRAVYALLLDETKIEIVWQELVDFQSVTSGRMIIEITEGGMTASRGAGDASKGFGSVSMTPLPGEDILVRRLADAASQAVEKGLAVKPQLAKKELVAVAPVTTVVAAAASTAPAEPAASAGASGPGPRSAGARRSSERSRGTRKRVTPPPSSGEES